MDTSYMYESQIFTGEFFADPTRPYIASPMIGVGHGVERNCVI